MIESDEMVGASKNGMGMSSPHVEILIPPWWAEAAEAIAHTASQPPVAFICGPKNSGKSTFSRYLLNIFLERFLPPSPHCSLIVVFILGSFILVDQ